MLKSCLRPALILCLIASLALAPPARAYSVLTHEVIVDLLWTENIVPLLRAKFPAVTDDELKQAHAYAYGGAIVQDMGYYPFGNKTFSDLTHYVRSGAFVEALLRDASDVNEYAFALGALAHYAADTEGHPKVNRAVADTVPKLRARFGNTVTYEDSPKAHIRVEFGFDVAQVAKARFPSSAYHDFIGFQVSKPLLERAVLETYGLKLSDILRSEDLAIGSYRRAVSVVIPSFTRAALLTHRADLVREVPNFDRKKFLYTLTRAQYEQDWGRTYERPGAGARILAFLFRLVPKIGPFKAADFTAPTAQTEDLYFKSVNQTVERYRAELQQLSAGSLHLRDLDFDTGETTRPGEYKLTDDTYAKLARTLDEKNFANLTPELRANILAFFADPNAKYATRRCHSVWRATVKSLDALRAAPAPQPANAAGHR